MADEKKAQEGAKQESKPQNKVIAWLKALPKRIATPFKNMVNELKRVTWPSKQKLIRYSIIVLVFVLIMMLIIGLFDFGSARLVNALHISKTAETTVQSESEAAPEATAEENGEAAPEANAEENGETAPEATAEENGETAPEANAEENGETAPEANAENSGETAPEADAENSGETAPEANAENSGETAPEADAENSGETALRETSAPVNNEGN